MMEVRRYSLAGWYSVFSCESHSMRVRPALRWSRALAMTADAVQWNQWERDGGARVQEVQGAEVQA